jgi:hypothetical protein
MENLKAPMGSVSTSPGTVSTTPTDSDPGSSPVASVLLTATPTMSPSVVEASITESVVAEASIPSIIATNQKEPLDQETSQAKATEHENSADRVPFTVPVVDIHEDTAPDDAKGAIAEEKSDAKSKEIEAVEIVKRDKRRRGWNRKFRKKAGLGLMKRSLLMA